MTSRSEATTAWIGLAIALVLAVSSLVHVANAESVDCDREMRDAQQAIELIKGIADRGISRARQANVPYSLISEMQSAGNGIGAQKKPKFAFFCTSMHSKIKCETYTF